MEQNKKRRTGKVCKRGGTREPRIEEGGGGGDSTLAANPAVPKRKRRSQSRPRPHCSVPRLALEPALLLTRRVSLCSPLSPSADMASGATPTAVKVRLEVLAAAVSLAQCSLAPVPGARASGLSALLVRPRRGGMSLRLRTRAGSPRGGEQGERERWPTCPSPLVSAASAPRVAWASPFERGSGPALRG